MPELPRGTITFLFSDIEGSTRLLARLRGRYAEALDEHDRVLRAAFAEQRGREIDTAGDGFFVAFARASDAIAAALAAQRGLARRRWREDLPVRVRMGIHTGEAIVQDGRYVGIDVHRAARICAAGHGGQVLISGATRELVGGGLPGDVALRDLGEHRLKDLDRPEHLFQLVADGLATAFPALRSHTPHADDGGGLPRPPNRTIGRVGEVRAISDRLRDRELRLLTLTGPGGVGKTRLAIEAGRAVQSAFPDGAWFVSLAALRRADDVASAIVARLRIVVLADETPQQAIERFLCAKASLLVLDNFEHVLAAAPSVGELLSACPSLTVLATSREPLALASEQRHPVAPLALPRDASDRATLLGVPAVALFVERARAHDPSFVLTGESAASVAQICRRLDGLPLAIELAAARCDLLSVSELADRLNGALAVLGHGPRDAPERQQTLRAAIEWSYELLTDAEKECFARFAGFAGGATTLAAEEITGGDLDTLDSLVAKNLLVRHHYADDGTRLDMLETIRADAAERLAGADAADVRKRHFRFFLGLAQREGSDRLLMGAAHARHRARLDVETENLRQALTWAVEQPHAGPALAMCDALRLYWMRRDHNAEAVEWIDRAMSLPGADGYSTARARLLCVETFALWRLGAGRERQALLEEAEDIARTLADHTTLSAVLRHRAAYSEGEDATSYADQAIEVAVAAGDDWQLALATAERATCATTIAELRERVDAAEDLLDGIGNVRDRAWLLAGAAGAALELGSYQDAKELLARVTPLAGDLDDPGLWLLIRSNFGMAALLTGDTDTASQAFREALTLSRDLVVRPVAHLSLNGLSAIAAIHLDFRRAAALTGAAASHRYGEPQPPDEAKAIETFVEPARRRCAAQAWDTAARHGAAMSLEEAIAYALDEHDE